MRLTETILFKLKFRTFSDTLDSMPERNSPDFKIPLAFATVYLVWGSTYIAIRFAIETIPPFLMAGVRFLCAGSLLYFFAASKEKVKPSFAQWKSAFLVGALLLVGGNGGVVWAEQLVPTGITALIIATVPLWTVLLEWLWRRQKRPSALVFLGILIGAAGLWFLVSPETNGVALHPVGVLVLLAAAFSWALGSIFARNADLPQSSFLATGMEMIGGGALMLTLGTLAGEWPQLRLHAISAKSFLSLLYLIFFGALVGFTAYKYILKRTSPILSSTYAYINPVIAVLLGWALAGEKVTWRIGVGALIILAGVFLITLSQKEKPSATLEAESV